LSPDISTLGTRSSQLEALRYVRVAAIRQFTLLRNQEKLIATTVNQKLKHVPNSTLQNGMTQIGPAICVTCLCHALKAEEAKEEEKEETHDHAGDSLGGRASMSRRPP
jgi:hypothetical protein